MILFESFVYSPKPKLRCVGRIIHDHYEQNGQLVCKTTFKVLKRKSQLSLSDMCVDSDTIAYLNLPSLPEGLYEIQTVGDWDDYEHIIVPYKENESE